MYIYLFINIDTYIYVCLFYRCNVSLPGLSPNNFFTAEAFDWWTATSQHIDTEGGTSTDGDTERGTDFRFDTEGGTHTKGGTHTEGGTEYGGGVHSSVYTGAVHTGAVHTEAVHTGAVHRGALPVHVWEAERMPKVVELRKAGY